MQVILLQSLTETNSNSESLSYHLTGSIDLSGYPSMPLDLWAPAGSGAPASLEAVLLAGQQFTRLYANGARRGTIRKVDLHIVAVPRRVLVSLEQAHIVSGDIAHAGDTVEIEATLQPWQQPERNLRVAFKLPTRLAAGNLRLLVSDGATLDRALYQPRLNAPPPDLDTVLAEARNQHPADRIYVSLLAPDAQGFRVRPSPAFRFPWPMPSSPCATPRAPASTANPPNSPPKPPRAVCFPVSRSSISTSSRAAV
jgi:hypothetical protein